MKKQTKKRILTHVLILAMMLSSFPAIFGALYDNESWPTVQYYGQDSIGGEDEVLRFTDDFLASASDHLFEDVSADEFRQILQDGGQIYRNLRVQSDYEGTRTYRVPMQESEIAYLLDILDIMDGTQPVVALDANPFPVTRIRYSGRSHADSVVKILFGDGFSAGAYGSWPNPAPGTVLWHADNLVNSWLNTHPFGLFQDLVTVYVIHTHGTFPGPGSASGYLGSISADGMTVAGTSSTTRSTRIEQLASTVVARGNQAIIQVISNAEGGTGWAWVWSHTPQNYLLHLEIGVTSIRNAANPPGGSVAGRWPNGTAWHGTVIHEIGHSFARLLDEHGDHGFFDGERRANATQATNANIKWQHWAGHRNVLATPTRFTTGEANGWAIPTIVGATSAQFSGCMMRASWGNRNFCGVCTAELVRRMAHISGEMFIGRSPSTNNPLPNTPIITIPQGTSRILDSAFHGNTSLNTITIPSSVSIIGDFAFIGATGLRTIVNHRTTPQQINATTFAGLNRANIEVRIPFGTTAAYLAAGWTGFRLVEPPANRSTVTFDLQGGTGNFPNQSVIHGSMATRPAVEPTPPTANHVFVDWFAHPTAGTTPFDFANTPITGDTTIYARWASTQADTATVRFHNFHNDGSRRDVTITLGTTVAELVAPTRYGSHGRPGQAFMGWFTVAPFNNMHYVNSPNRAIAFDFTHPITTGMLTDGVLNLHGSWLRYGNVLGRGNENTMPNMMDHGMLHARALGMITDADIIMVTADVNADGSVNMADHGMLHRFVLGMPTILGIPAP